MAIYRTFSDRVLEIALSIPAGRVMTYGTIAKAAGGGGQAARSVTSILGKAYERGARNIPFHRIVYSNGTVFHGFSGDEKRRRLYKKEGIKVDAKGRILNFRDIVIELK